MTNASAIEVRSETSSASTWYAFLLVERRDDQPEAGQQRQIPSARARPPGGRAGASRCSGEPRAGPARGSVRPSRRRSRRCVAETGNGSCSQQVDPARPRLGVRNLAERLHAPHPARAAPRAPAPPAPSPHTVSRCSTTRWARSTSSCQRCHVADLRERVAAHEEVELFGPRRARGAAAGCRPCRSGPRAPPRRRRRGSDRTAGWPAPASRSGARTASAARRACAGG